MRSRLTDIRRRAVRLYQHRALTTFIILAVASAICVTMVVARITVYNSMLYRFMIWNLFLAWIPFAISLWLYQARVRSRSAFAIAACAWLAFFPNAPYMVTDLIHLRSATSGPLWYDALMLTSFAWTGLFLGLISLRMMQSLVRKRWGNLVSWGFALAVLALSGFGIYLGRIQRWNSWDVVTNPSLIVGGLLRGMLNPFAHPQAVAMTFLLTIFLTMAYVMTATLLGRRAEPDEHDF